MNDGKYTAVSRLTVGRLIEILNEFPANRSVILTKSGTSSAF